MRSSRKSPPQDEPARRRHGRHEPGETGRHEPGETGRIGGWDDPPAAAAIGTIAGVVAVAVTAFASLGSVVRWPLVLTVAAAAFVGVHRGSRRRARELGIRVLRARRLIAVIVLLAAVTTILLYSYLVRHQQSAVRRNAELLLGVGLHADLDSRDVNWDQGIDGYEGDIYFDTGRSAQPPRKPRIQGGLIGENRWTRIVPLGTGFVVSRRACTAKLRENPPQNIPVNRLRPGYQFCVETNKRRWAFVTLIGQPGPQRLRLDVLIWEHQHPTASASGPSPRRHAPPAFSSRLTFAPVPRH
jgi:hypothetical protein